MSETWSGNSPRWTATRVLPNVAALTDSLIASMTPAQFERVLAESPAAARWMIGRLAASVRELTAKLFDLTVLATPQRVCAEVLRRARVSGVEGNVAVIDPAPKHAEIAASISATREQVARAMSSLAASDIVSVRAGKLHVGDVERLAALSRPEGS